MEDISREIGITVNIITLGEGTVGKSSLIARFVDNKFDPVYSQTIGVDFKITTLRVKENDFKIRVWDTAGQENFRNRLPRTYFDRADGIMFVYDLSNTQTEERLKNWINDAKDNTKGDFGRVVVGNKKDLVSEPDLDIPIEMAKNLGCELFLTSARSGENVRDAYTALIQDIIRRKPQFAGAESRNSIITVSTTQKHKKKCC